MTNSQHTRDEASIRESIDAWSRAVEAKDIKGIVAAYTDATVLFDAIPPAKTVGAEAIGAAWAKCFPYFPEKFRSEHEDLTIEVSGDLAFVYGMYHFIPERADHPGCDSWMRVTACYKRIHGQWRVAHEHVSIPFDPVSGKAVSIRTPDGKPTPPTAVEKAAARGVHAVTPHLICKDAVKAIEFYKEAFGAIELMRLDGPGGQLLHACLTINGSSVMLVDEYPEMNCKSPATIGGSPVTIHLTVDDADASIARAVAAGAKVVMPAADMFWGDRYGVIEDPFGHTWSIATPVRDLSAEEIRAAVPAGSCGSAQQAS